MRELLLDGEGYMRLGVVERNGRLEEGPDPRAPYRAKFDMDNPGAVVKLSAGPRSHDTRHRC
jgi:hypothetical protein